MAQPDYIKFLRKYQIRPAVVDGVVLRSGKILLVKRRKDPEFGKWAVPGGFVNWGETCEQAVVREVREETNLKVKPVRLLGVYSSQKRDPLRGTIAVAFVCKYLSGTPRGGDDAELARWWDLGKLPALAFDHAKIIKDALTKS